MRQILEQTYRAHRQGLFSLALSVCGCRSLAEDAVHAAFERLCRTTALPEGDAVAYVYAAVRNAAVDLRRSQQRSDRLRDSLYNGFAGDGVSQQAPAEELLTAERDELLRDAVDGLAEDSRSVVVLKIYADLTFEQIGQVMRQPTKTVATKYRRALLKLDEKLRGLL